MHTQDDNTDGSINSFIAELGYVIVHITDDNQQLLDTGNFSIDWTQANIRHIGHLEII